MPVYKAHGVAATFAVIASRAETPTGTTTSGDAYEAMDWDQVRALVADGFDMQSHTWSHDRAVFNGSYNQDATDAQIEAEYRRADDAFRAHGLTYNCMTFPFGASQIRHLNLARRYAMYGVNCRGTCDGLNYLGQNPMDLNRAVVATNGSNLAQIKAWMDTAKTKKAWMIVCTHAGGTQPTAAQIDELLTYAETIGIRTETFAAAARMKGYAYYAGVHGTSPYYVTPSGGVHATLDDASIIALLSRAYSIGAIAGSVKSVSGIAAAYGVASPAAGDTLLADQITVTVTYSDDTTASTTDYTVDQPDRAFEIGNNDYTIHYGNATCTLRVSVSAVGSDYLGAYTLTGEASAAAPATITDTSGNGNDLTVSGISAYTANGYLAVAGSGQTITLAALSAGAAAAIKIHMEGTPATTVPNQNRFLYANGVQFMFTKPVDNTGVNLKIEDAGGNVYAPAARIGGTSASVTAVSGISRINIDVTISDAAITVDETLWFSADAIHYTESHTVAYSGLLTAIRSSGCTIFNRPAGDRALCAELRALTIEAVTA